MRASSVLQARVREAEYQDLRSRADSRSLEGFMFLHLKKGLDDDPLSWVGCMDAPAVGPRGVHGLSREQAAAAADRGHSHRPGFL
jgi:hypothetical protein